MAFTQNKQDNAAIRVALVVVVAVLAALCVAAIPTAMPLGVSAVGNIYPSPCPPDCVPVPHYPFICICP